MDTGFQAVYRLGYRIIQALARRDFYISLKGIRGESLIGTVQRRMWTVGTPCWKAGRASPVVGSVLC